VSGVSGCGIVAEGVEWSDGSATMHWLGQEGGSHDSQANTTNSHGIVRGIDTMRIRHEHEGAGVITYVDEQMAEEKPIAATIFGLACMIYRKTLYVAQEQVPLIRTRPRKRLK